MNTNTDGVTVAIASGKGGTGKTTVATNLAWLAAEQGYNTVYLDGDVEEPNGWLFLKPEEKDRTPVAVPVPEVDQDACTDCRLCSRICAFGALACVGGQALVFPELCHACGGCWTVCPTGALRPVERVIGTVRTGWAGPLRCLEGRLSVGEPVSPPVIAALRGHAPETELTIIDAPPGTACPAIAAIKDSDYVILVTEPTPFGLNDLGMALDLCRSLHLPCGVLINRSTAAQDDETEEWCQEQSVPIIGRLPQSRAAAEAYSRGGLLVAALPEMAVSFRELLSFCVSIRTGVLT